MNTKQNINAYNNHKEQFPMGSLAKIDRAMQKTLYILILTLLISCINRTSNTIRPARLSDDNIIVTKRLFSPDSSYVVYGYHYDIGALGYSRGVHSIVKTDDTLGIISKHVIPDLGKPTYSPLRPVKWIDNSTLLTKVNIDRFVHENIKVDTTPFRLGKITIKIITPDPTNGKTAIIEHIAPSYDYSKLMIAYRYTGASELDISVIDFVSELPDLGNVYIQMNTSANPILYGKWIRKDKIQLDLNQKRVDYFTPNKQAIVKIEKKIIDHKPKYSAIQGGWYNKPLYPTDTTFQYELDKYGQTTKAVIENIYGWGDTYYSHKYNHFYEYKVNDRKYKSYFRIKKDSLDIQIGDSLEIIYSERQPMIHRFEEQLSLTRGHKTLR